MKPFISVIVPAYNAEKTLVQVLEDILGQTYENYELILVDDGSTDGTAEICDRCAANHTNVRVIHQENRGASAARNRGTELAQGEYVSYVDSDDRIEKDYLEKLVDAISTTGAEVACGGVDRMREDAVPDDRKRQKKGTVIELLDRRQALSEMLTRRKLKVGPWCRLVPRTWMTDAPFPEGKYYEDLSQTYRILLRAKKTAVVNKTIYHYVRRSGSITGRKHATLPQCLDYHEAIHLCAEGVRNALPDLEKDIAALEARDYMSLFLLLQRCTEQNRETERIKKEIEAWIKANWRKAAGNPNAPLSVRMRTLLFRLSPDLYRKMYYVGIGIIGKKLG